jgi:hypothetical protein
VVQPAEDAIVVDCDEDDTEPQQVSVATYSNKFLLSLESCYMININATIRLIMLQTNPV